MMITIRGKQFTVHEGRDDAGHFLIADGARPGLAPVNGVCARTIEGLVEELERRMEAASAPTITGFPSEDQRAAFEPRRQTVMLDDDTEVRLSECSSRVRVAFTLDGRDAEALLYNLDLRDGLGIAIAQVVAAARAKRGW